MYYTYSMTFERKFCIRFWHEVQQSRICTWSRPRRVCVKHPRLKLYFFHPSFLQPAAISTASFHHPHPPNIPYDRPNTPFSVEARTRRGIAIKIRHASKIAGKPKKIFLHTWEPVGVRGGEGSGGKRRAGGGWGWLWGNSGMYGGQGWGNMDQHFFYFLLLRLLL